MHDSAQTRPESPQIGLRWTIGDVNAAGFEALQLSIAGAWRIFGLTAHYLVCVNSIPGDEARERTGVLPVNVEWREVSRHDLPHALRFGETIAEGTGWKFCPLRAFDSIPELALDNDCILWEMPPAVERWLDRGSGCLIAEDVRPHFGRFSPHCGNAPRNSGIRGLWPDFPFEEGILDLLDEGTRLDSEGDEQGLQVACLHTRGTPEVVSVDDVTICSPFPPHVQMLGRCGVHFVGLNTRRFAWSLEGRNPADITRELWERLKPAVIEKVLAPGGEAFIRLSHHAVT